MQVNHFSVDFSIAQNYYKKLNKKINRLRVALSLNQQALQKFYALHNFSKRIDQKFKYANGKLFIYKITILAFRLQPVVYLMLCNSKIL